MFNYLRSLRSAVAVVLMLVLLSVQSASWLEWSLCLMVGGLILAVVWPMRINFDVFNIPSSTNHIVVVGRTTNKRTTSRQELLSIVQRENRVIAVEDCRELMVNAFALRHPFIERVRRALWLQGNCTAAFHSKRQSGAESSRSRPSNGCDEAMDAHLKRPSGK